MTLAWFIHTGRLNLWVAGLGVEIAQIICYILLITIKNSTAKYIFVMIATAASQSFFPILWPGKFRICNATPCYNALANGRGRADPRSERNDDGWVSHWLHQCKLPDHHPPLRC